MMQFVAYNSLKSIDSVIVAFLPAFFTTTETVLPEQQEKCVINLYIMRLLGNTSCGVSLLALENCYHANRRMWNRFGAWNYLKVMSGTCVPWDNTYFLFYA